MPRHPPALTRENNPGGARWCEQHKRLECVKNKSRGRGQCHCLATRGTDSCTMHSGVRKGLLKAQGEARIQAITAWRSMGGSPTISAPVAVMAVLEMSYLRLASYSEALRKQVYEIDQQHGGSGLPEIEPGEGADGEQGSVSLSGLIGFRYGAAGKDGHIYAQSEEIRALVQLEATERDRIVKYAKVAHDMGISERLTGLAERWSDLVATRISALFDALELTPEQSAKVPALVQTHLGTIDLEALGAGTGKKAA